VIAPTFSFHLNHIHSLNETDSLNVTPRHNHSAPGKSPGQTDRSIEAVSGWLLGKIRTSIGDAHHSTVK
jgi:hypothetical protein